MLLLYQHISNQIDSVLLWGKVFRIVLERRRKYHANAHKMKKVVSYVTLQIVSKNKQCDVIKMRDYPPPQFKGFLSLFSHLSHFYDVRWLIFETLCKVTLFLLN